MDYLWQIHYDYSWGGLLTQVMILGALYALLRFSAWWLARLPAPSPWQTYTHTLSLKILLVFEPLVILILSSYFVLIKPFYHGLIMLLLMFTNFRHLRNYFSGTIVRLDPSIRVGNRLSSQQKKGIITEVGRLGLRLQNSKGIHFLDYDQLWQHGYTLLNSEDSGRFYYLKITPTEALKTSSPKNTLLELLHVSPYLDWQHQPRFEQPSTKNDSFLLHLALHDQRHLADLIDRLAEDHFSCTIAKR